MPRHTLPFVALAALAAAQQGPPTFVPKPHLARFAAEDVPKLLEQLPQSAAGKLLAEPEVAAAWASALQRYRERAARIATMLAAARTRGLELEPWMHANLPMLDGWVAVREVDLADLQRVELLAIAGDEQEGKGFLDPATVAILTCRPRAEGRWTAIFERHAQALAAGKWWRSEPDVKFAGFPAYGFEVAGRGDADPDPRGQLGDMRIWLLHLPGLFAFGGTTPDACGTLAPPPPRPPAQLVGEMDLGAFVTMFGRTGQGIPAEFAALGFDGLKMLRWRGRFVGSRILTEFEVEAAGEPKGLVGALLAGKAKPPAQPLPDGALAQLRCGLDLPLLVASLEQFGANDLMPAALWQRCTQALTGGVALGVTAPPPGGLVPRIYLSLGIADPAALDELLGHFLPDDGAPKKVTYEGTECTVLTLPGVPAALQPTFCRLDGVLHVAESRQSMRAFLKARSKGGEALDVGDAPLPDGAGELLPTFDVRCDEQALYRTFHKIWLPLLKLIPDADGLQPLLGEDDMPSPDAVLPHLGSSRGVLRRDGKVWRLQQLGALGGVETAALAMVWGPLVSGVFHRNWLGDELESTLARAQLTAIWPAFEAFQTEHKRWPNDLGELFVARKLPADSLLLPGDPNAETVPMPAGDAPAVKTSYRYFPKPVNVDVQGNTEGMLLIAIAPRRYYRPMLGSNGAIPHVWGADSTRPIDQFGK